MGYLVKPFHYPELAARLTVVPGVVFRGALNTGFRAPSLQQSFFSSTATNFISGVPFEVKTAPVGSPVAVALGARPLKAEKSVNYSAGVALEPYVPQETALVLLTCGARYAIAERGGWSAQGRWVWWWKNRVDRRWMRSLA